ncbi:hypothetical protein [Clostridium sp.]|uniref:hypothetical protein n=1 Tax=Clostridium sp. TaxID=1506 RepID=UPI001A3D65CC|nr:hypothetical protein [Clostridium sp.]MBK5235145.1 hypothetical protein [Clostridium sp.]
MDIKERKNLILHGSMSLMGIFSVFQGIFQGSGHKKYSMNMEIGRLCFVRLPKGIAFQTFYNNWLRRNMALYEL